MAQDFRRPLTLPVEPSPGREGTAALAYYQRLLSPLGVLLRGQGLPVSTDRWQNVWDYLLALSAQGRLPPQTADLKPLLAPLLCRSALEREQFELVFDHWLQDVEPDANAAGSDHTSRSAQSVPGGVKPPTPKLRWWLLGLILGLALIAGGAYWWHRQSLSEADPELEHPIVRAPPAISTCRPPDTNCGYDDQTASLTLQAIPPRHPPEPPRLDTRHQARLAGLHSAALALPAALSLAALLWLWLSWRTALKRRQGNPDDPLGVIALEGAVDPLFDAPPLREALKRLHTSVLQPTRRLDARATVERTARCAGLFQPVRRQRRVVPEWLVMVEQRHAGDQMAGLAGQVVARLQAAGLTVTRYRYRDASLRAFAVEGRWLPPADIAARHPGARLLVIGEPAGLIDPHSGMPTPALLDFGSLAGRGLLFTRRPLRAWRTALAGSGFVAVDLNSAGLETLAARFGSRGQGPTALSDTTVPLPPVLQDGPRWTRPHAPPGDEQKRVLGILKNYLKEDGLYLLAAMAVYPQLHWGLTRVLDVRLFPGDGALARETRLLQIARLPWCRLGWLPDWLRAALAEQLAPDEKRALRELFRQLLGQVTVAGNERFGLPVALPVWGRFWPRLQRWWALRSWRLDRWLASLRTLSSAHGALQDRLFAKVLFGWRLRPLDFVLPRRLRPRTAGAGLVRALAPAALVLALLAGAGSWLAHEGWQRWGVSAATVHLLANQNATHRAYTVEIWYRRTTADLARVLGTTLERDGFEVAAKELPAKSAAGGLLEAASPVNRVQWGDEVDVHIATYLERRLSYLSYGGDPEVTNQLGSWSAADPALAAPPAGGELRILLLSPGATGARFADPLDPLSPETLGGGAPPLRDALKGGGYGPAMLLLPAGRFTMGSPVDEPERSKDEGPQQLVTIASFYLGQTEVTFDDYDRFARATKRPLPDDEGWGRGTRPVINVSWQDARDYAAWLSRQTGQNYRLPSEAEWEYAARGGTETPFWTGDCIHTDQANYNGDYDYNGCGAATGVYLDQTVLAGSLPANAFGLHEVLGNAWEWVEDCWHDSYKGAPVDGSAWLEDGGGECALRVLRGGSWKDLPWDLRSANRDRDTADVAKGSVGFRLARTP